MDYSHDFDFFRLIVPCNLDRQSEAVREAIKSGLQQDWGTSWEGGSDDCIYLGSLNDHRHERYQTTQAIDYLLENREGSITLFVADTSFTITVNDAFSDILPVEVGGVKLTWERANFRDILLEETDEKYKVEGVINTVRRFYEHVQPPFAFSQLPYEWEYEVKVTQQHLDTPELPDIYWLVFLSPELCEDIGRSRVRSAPVWKVEDLADGGLGLVATNNLRYSREHKQRLRAYLGISP
ncbi:Uncharacterized protein SVXHr_0044 [Halorhabdus sp. SVX81]|nr:Uncharacterized protein SVXHr_0044 [Halorhabdus sp. SVX81]